MTATRLVTNQNMDIVKECTDENDAISYIMSQPEDAKLEMYTLEEYERFTPPDATQLEAVLAEGEGEGEIISFEGTLKECIEWAKGKLAERSTGCVEIIDPKTGECIDLVNKTTKPLTEPLNG